MDAHLEPVAAWLEAGAAADYQAGVLLLQQHSRNRGLVAHLLKKESPANYEKLVYELLKLHPSRSLAQVGQTHSHYMQAVREAVPAPAAREPAPVPDLAEQPAPGEVPEALRPQVDDLTQLMGQLYNRRCQLSNSLADLAPAEAPPVVAEILTLQDQYNALAEKRRRVLAGEQPPAAEAAPVEPATAPAIDRAALLQQRGNLRSNISKTRGKLEKAQTEAKRSELSQKLGQLEVELIHVEGQLKQPQA